MMVQRHIKKSFFLISLFLFTIAVPAQVYEFPGFEALEQEPAVEDAFDWGFEDDSEEPVAEEEPVVPE